MTHISDILSKALSQYSPPQKTEIARIWEVWDLALGTSIAQNAKPDTFNNGQLQVIVSNSVWIHQLKFLEKEMVENLNAKLASPLITNMRFKIGKILFWTILWRKSLSVTTGKRLPVQYRYLYSVQTNTAPLPWKTNSWYWLRLWHYSCHHRILLPPNPHYRHRNSSGTCAISIKKRH